MTGSLGVGEPLGELRAGLEAERQIQAEAAREVEELGDAAARAAASRRRTV